jgi:hypothetical protein
MTHDAGPVRIGECYRSQMQQGRLNMLPETWSLEVFDDPFDNYSYNNIIITFLFYFLIVHLILFEE